jgi:hypothetical protein
METGQIIAIVLSVLGTLAVQVLVGFVLAGGNGGRLQLGLRVLMRTLTDEAFAEKVQPLLAPPKPVKPSGAPLRLLTLMQREGRLIDFILEDVQQYPPEQNAQIGAAVRDIHKGCQKVLREHLVLEPVMGNAREGETVEVPAGFDPANIRLVGNVTGSPPFKGTLQHHGWRVREIKLAEPAEGQDEFVLQPAEVEIP